jgi:thiosulfate/3-mercaptopyruvate sulfurtransferase
MAVDTLMQRLRSDAPRLVDVRGVSSFEMEHIPGAVQLDPNAVRANVDGVSGQVAPEDDVRALWESLGLVETDAVVVYGADNGTDPARVVWTLAYYGHTGSVWALDGGFQAWTGDVESGPASPTPSTYSSAVVADLRVDEAQVLASLDDGSFTLFDARGAGEYGAGHIPGAINVDWTDNLGPGGLLLPTEELEALYGPPNAGETLVTYCQTGSRASVDWLVLVSLGFEDVRLYDGSWAEWSADSSNPVE